MNRPHNTTASQAMTAEERSNFRHLVFDIVWFGVAFPSIARFLSVYAIRLGATPMQIGWLTALPAVVALGSSSLAVWWRRYYTDATRAVFWPGLGYRLMFLLPALTPFFPADWQPVWLILAVAIPALPQGISSVLFLVLMRESVQQTRLTALMGRRSLTFNIGFGISTLAWGLWLGWIAFPINYQIMFVVTFIASVISLLHVQQVFVLNTTPALLTDQPAVRPWRSPGFRRVAFFTIITHISFTVLQPIIPLWLVDRLGADETTMSIFGLAELVGAATMSVFTGQIAQRIGSRLAMSVGMFGAGIAGIMLAAAPGVVFTYPAAALSGAAWNLMAISLFGYFSDNAPIENITGYTTIYNQVVSLSFFIGPLLGSQLASFSPGLFTVLLIGAGMRLVASVLIPQVPSRRSLPVRRARPSFRQTK
ncbi:MAG: MFS transporter [Anaerolineae bacterium]|nr:MFS transporter [Anaerolineae bacterium]